MNDFIRNRICKLMGILNSKDDPSKLLDFGDRIAYEWENAEKLENQIAEVQREAFKNQVTAENKMLKTFEQMAANYVNGVRGETGSPIRGISDENWEFFKKREPEKIKEKKAELPTEFGQRKIRIGGDQGS